MNAAHEPSMDDILKSIRRIIRTDQDGTPSTQTSSADAVTDLTSVDGASALPAMRGGLEIEDEADDEETVQLVAIQEDIPARPAKVAETRQDDDNLIRMKIHDQKRLRILEKKLQTIEEEYEQKLQLHRRKMSDYRRQNQQLTAAMEAGESRMEAMSESLKTAHEALEKLQLRNKALKDKVLQMARFEQGTAVLKTIQREFLNLYHPDRIEGDNISRMVRHEVYNEVSQVLEGVQARFQSRRS